MKKKVSKRYKKLLTISKDKKVEILTLPTGQGLIIKN